MSIQELLRATFDADPKSRKRAEIELRQAESAPEFIINLLEIVRNSQNVSLTKAAAIYLKNRISRGWSADDAEDPATAIPISEKPPFRQMLIQTIIENCNNSRSHLRPVLNKILTYDFPDRWPEFGSITAELVRSDQGAVTVHVGLIFLMEMSKIYRWKGSNQRFGLIEMVRMLFPSILSIGQQSIENSNDLANEMVYLILKVYKFAISVELPDALQKPNSIIPWGNFLLTVVTKRVPSEVYGLDVHERSNNYLVKSKKWAYDILNKLFCRYGNHQNLALILHPSERFADMFTKNFAPTIIETYITELSLWTQNEVWLSDRCIASAIEFLEECVKPKSTWVLLKPHVEFLLSQIIFRLLCHTEKDEELWEDSPVDYIHQKIDVYREYVTPDVAATNLIYTLASKRRTTTLLPILNFINGVLTKYQQAPLNEKNPGEKEGALRMISTISTLIACKKSPYAHLMESFLNMHVFPEFTSPHGFLRSRACEMINSFSGVEFKLQNNIGMAYTSILNCLQDKDLPVRVEAALALPPLIRYCSVKTAMAPHIAKIMQQLLRLTEEVDVEMLGDVMETFVEEFHQEMTPFAVELAATLTSHFLRLMQGYARNGDDFENDDSGDMDSKLLAAMGLLKTVSTLILSVESSAELTSKIEQAIFPMLDFGLRNEIIDVYTELFEIVSSITYATKTTTSITWQTFGLMYHSFKSSGLDYFEEMIPALDNLITFGYDVIEGNHNYLAAIIDIIKTVFESDRLGTADRIHACVLTDSLLLHTGNAALPYLEYFIEMVMNRFTEGVRNTGYAVLLIEIIINSLYQHPVKTLEVLRDKGYTSRFFRHWYNNIANYARVYDKKLNILGIISLLSLPQDQLDEEILHGWTHLLEGMLQLFKTLPQAIAKRTELIKEEENCASEEASDDDEWANGEWEETEDEVDVKDNANEYLDYLSTEAKKYYGEYADEINEIDECLEEDVTMQTALDNVDPYQVFQNFFSKLEAERNSYLITFVEGIDQETKEIIYDVLGRSQQTGSGQR